MDSSQKAPSQQELENQVAERTITGTDNILRHFAAMIAKVDQDARNVQAEIEKFTGHHPSNPIGPLEIVKIMHKYLSSINDAATKN